MMIVRSACLSLALIFAGTAVTAQDAPASAPPPAVPTPAPAGFSGRAHITLRIPTQSSIITMGAHVAVSQRDQLTRVDVLSVDARLLPMQIPPLTFVIDRRTNTITSWNDAAQVYYTQSFLPAGFRGPSRRAPLPGTSTRASRRERSMLANLDLLTFNLRLTGHTTTAGIAATGLAYDAKIRQHGQTAVTHMNGIVQLADAFAFFPVELEAQISGSGLAAPGRFSYLVDAFAPQAPPPEQFVVPSNYREAASLIGVFSGIPRRPPAPAPSDTPSAMTTSSPPATL